LVEIVDLPEDNDMYQKGERRKCRYRLERPEPSDARPQMGWTPHYHGFTGKSTFLP
jgi:hypothetical protein